MPQRSRSVAPIYKRLPHGPHQLDRSDVMRHQRARIHGAMIEAVARDGYEETTIKQVIGLAGVSRKSFYELFENKQACFLETFDVVALREIRRARENYLSAGGDPAERLGAVFASWEQALHREPTAAAMVLLEIQKAGSAGTARLCRAAAGFEQMLARILLGPRGPVAPAPLVRGVAGGLHWTLAGAARSAPEDSRDLTQDLLDWTLPFLPSPAADATALLSLRLRDRVRKIALRGARGAGREPREPTGERARLEHEVLRLMGRQHQSELTAARIADRAGLGIDTFFEHYETPLDCLRSALSLAGDELLSVAAAPGPATEEWPGATHRRCAALLVHLAEHPLQARALALDAYGSGDAAIARHLELSASLGSLLMSGAPRGTASPIAEGAVGALWHTLRHQVAGGRVALLAALPDHLGYVVMAPVIGAEAAWEAVVKRPL